MKAFGGTVFVVDNCTFILSASALEKSVVCQGNALHWNLIHSMGKSQDA